MHSCRRITTINPLRDTPATCGFVLWLSVAQLMSWGTLFYAFSLLLEHFERDLRLSCRRFARL